MRISNCAGETRRIHVTGEDNLKSVFLLEVLGQRFGSSVGIVLQPELSLIIDIHGKSLDDCLGPRALQMCCSCVG